MGRQFGLQPLRADGRCVLIAGAARDEIIVGDIQPEFPVFSLFAHMKRIFAFQRHRFEPHVFDNKLAAHFPPFTLATRSPRPSCCPGGRASLTRILRPRMSIPFNFSMASSASSRDPNSTNPNPRERPPSRSQVTRAEVTRSPRSLNSCRNSSFVISGESCPTYTFVIDFPLYLDLVPPRRR